VPDNVPVSKNGRSKVNSGPAKFQMDSRSKTVSVIHSMSLNTTPLKTKSTTGGFMTLGPRKKIKSALKKIKILPKSNHFS